MVLTSTSIYSVQSKVLCGNLSYIFQPLFAKYTQVLHYSTFTLIKRQIFKALKNTYIYNMDQIVQTLEPLRQFSKDSIRLVKRCTKPDRKGTFNFIILARCSSTLKFDYIGVVYHKFIDIVF